MKKHGQRLEPFLLDAGSALRIEDIALLYKKLTGKNASKDEMARACQLLDIELPSKTDLSISGSFSQS